MSAVLERLAAIPRAARWGVYALGVFVLYFVLIEPALDQRAALQARADEKEKQLLLARTGSGEAEAAQTELRTGVTKFGIPELPGAPAERSQAFNKRIASVLQAHGIRDHTSTVKEVPLAGSTLAASFGADYRVDRLITDLQFDASPEAFAGILADLERAPEVAAVSRVQLRKGPAAPGSRAAPPRVLKVNLSVEAWELARKGKPR